MLSKQTDRNYIIQERETEPPFKINKNKADKYLRTLLQQADALRKTIASLYDQNNYEFYSLLNHEVFDTACLDLEEGRLWKLDHLIDELREMQKHLAENDDDLQEFQFSQNRAVNLYDLGYQNLWYNSYWLEKILENTDEKEVAEEIHFKNDPPLRRIRTTYWEKTDYGKSSKNIVYRKLPVGKKLMAAVQNTRLIEEQKQKG